MGIKKHTLFLDSFLIFVAVSVVVSMVIRGRRNSSDLEVESYLPPQSFRQWNALGKEVVSFFSKECLSDRVAVQNFCQKYFLRPSGCERGSSQEKKHFDALLGSLDCDQKKGIWNLLLKNGFINDVYPSKKVYDRVLIFGGYFKTMNSRLRFFDRLVSLRKIYLGEGCRIDFLVGDRPLCPWELKDLKLDLNKKSKNLFMRPVVCEWDLPVWSWICSVRAPVLKRYPYRIIKVKKDGCVARVQTADTLRVFLDEMNGFLGNVLIVSSNPFVSYQGLTAKALFLERGLPIDTVDVVGPNDVGTSVSNEALGRILDSFARAFYQKIQLENIRFSGHKKEG